MSKQKAASIPTFEEMLREKVAREGFGGFPGLTLGLGGMQAPGAKPRQQRPDANSKILLHYSGAKFLVIDGIAYGYASSDIFRRLHYDGPECETRRWPLPVQTTCNDYPHPRTYDLGLFPDIQGDTMDPQCALVTAPDSGCVCLIRSGYVHPVYPARAFDNYQFRWDHVGRWWGSLDDWHNLKGGVALTEQVGGLYDP